MPNLDDHVVAARHDYAVLGVEFNCGDEVVVRVDLLLLLPEVQVPNADGLVVRAGVEVFTVGVQGQTAHPVVVSHEGMKMLSGLQDEQLNEFIAASGEEEALEIVGDSLCALLFELFQGVHPRLWGKLML
jgi:hypothetical protein